MRLRLGKSARNSLTYALVNNALIWSHLAIRSQGFC